MLPRRRSMFATLIVCLATGCTEAPPRHPPVRFRENEVAPAQEVNPRPGDVAAQPEPPADDAIAKSFEDVLDDVPDGATPRSDAEILQLSRIEPTADGLREYLRSLPLDEAQQQRAATLIGDLGSAESFARRERAMQQLLRFAVPPAALLAAVDAPDPEVRWRARRILAAVAGKSESLTLAALRIIPQKDIPGLVPDVLDAVPRLSKPHLLRAAGEAVAATARREDADVLRRALQSANLETRLAAVGALAKALGPSAADELDVVTRDGEERMQLAAARALAALADRRGAAALRQLGSAADTRIRAGAVAALRDLDEGPEHREPLPAGAVQRIGTRHEQQRLRHPDPITGLALAPDGRTLASAGKEVRLWDVATGRQLRQWDHRMHSLAFSPDGTRLAGGAIGMVLVWDVVTGGELLQLNGDEQPVVDLSFSPDGRSLAARDAAGKRCLWDLRSRDIVRLPSGPMVRVLFTPDSKPRVLRSLDEKSSELANAITGNPVHRLAKLTGNLHASALSPDGKTLAAVAYNGSP